VGGCEVFLPAISEFVRLVNNGNNVSGAEKVRFEVGRPLSVSPLDVYFRAGHFVSPTKCTIKTLPTVLFTFIHGMRNDY
jgi:hypothetical protein